MNGCVAAENVSSVELTSFELDLSSEITQLERALRLLGYRQNIDPMPSPTEEVYIELPLTT